MLQVDKVGTGLEGSLEMATMMNVGNLAFSSGASWMEMMFWESQDKKIA